MTPIYCISGLGADERIFSKLALPGVTLIPLQWIRPDKNEAIEAYARRMTGQLPSPPYSPVPGAARPLSLATDSMNPAASSPNQPEENLSNQPEDRREMMLPDDGQEELWVLGDGPPPTLMGVSFGGMMALEIAKYYTNAKVILLSSVKCRKELPGWMRLAGSLGLNKLIPQHTPRWTRMQSEFLGTETDEEVQLVREFMKTADPVYLRWALGQVITWKNNWQPASLAHIHGSNDKTFPLKNIKATHVVPGGGHFMVMNRAKEVSAIIQSILASSAITRDPL